VCLRGHLNAEQIQLLRAGIDANLANLSPRAKVASAPDDPGYFVEDFCTWQDNAFIAASSSIPRWHARRPN